VPISLPTKPDGDEYEDLVGACLLALGYFVETNLHLRDGTVEILELDVIATPATSPLTAILLDAKSGKSGFADVFKMFGWMQYLGIAKGCVVRTDSVDPVKQAALAAIQKATNVHIATIDISSKEFEIACLEAAALPTPQEVRTPLLVNGWYGRIGQRKCMKAFNDFCKSQGPDVVEVKAARDYRWAIEQAFLASTPIKRASQLYSAYIATSQVTRRLVDLLAGGDETLAAKEWSNIRDRPERLALQYALMMENAARLGIMKNALIHVLDVEAKQPTPMNSGTFDWSEFAEWTMPDSFKAALLLLKANPYREKIPLLFQIFIELFGGFYRVDDNADIKQLAASVMIPESHVISCLELFDSFFPIPSGWFVTAKDELRMMKMVPAVYRGTGAFLRNSFYKALSYDKLYPKMGWLVNNWHGALYKILEPHLATVAASTPAAAS